MEDNHDEEDDKLLVYCKRESDEHAGEEEYISGDYTRERAHIPMQKDAELEDGHSDDLHYHGIGKRGGRARRVGPPAPCSGFGDSPISM